MVLRSWTRRCRSGCHTDEPGGAALFAPGRVNLSVASRVWKAVSGRMKAIDDPAAVVRLELPLVLEVPTDDGFDVLYAEHQPHAIRLAGLLTGDRARAEDIAADAFARVFVKWQAGQVQNVWPYLRMTIVNEVRGRWRRGTSDRETDRRVREAASTAAAPRSVEDGAIDRVALAAALERLSPRQRIAVVLRFYEDLTEAATAELMGCSVGTVKTTVSRALGRLRLSLALGDEDGTGDGR